MRTFIITALLMTFLGCATIGSGTKLSQSEAEFLFNRASERLTEYREMFVADPEPWEIILLNSARDAIDFYAVRLMDSGYAEESQQLQDELAAIEGAP